MTTAPDQRRRGKKLRLLFLLEAWLEAPMFLLALLWVWLFAVEMVRGQLSLFQERALIVIWLLFILEFLVKLAVAPRKLKYVKNNLLTLIALAIPAFRVFRLLRALRILRMSRAISTTRFVRALTSTKRLVQDLKEAQGHKPSTDVNIGVLIAYSDAAEYKALEAFARQMVSDVEKGLTDASGIAWVFDEARGAHLDTDKPHRPSDFLDDASRHMAEGPYDIVVVITDVPLISRKKRVEAGFVSSVTRIVSLSTWTLTETARGLSRRSTASAPVRWNGAALLMHLLGRLAGLRHRTKQESEVMAPFAFREHRQALPSFTKEEREALTASSKRIPERELRGGGALASLIFHILMMARHPREVLVPLLKSRSLLLPLSLPGLATAAVAPTLLMVFSAEMWDVGLNMETRTASIFAVCSVLAASFYLVKIQSLFLPRRDKETVTEHLAVANGVIFLSILSACFGLFIMVCSLMLLIEIYVFPEGLMRTWPTLNNPDISFGDQLRLAGFISTIGVTTGALAGGLEKRAVIQHLALFQEHP